MGKDRRSGNANRYLFQAWLNGDIKDLYTKIKYKVGRENRLKLTDRQVLEYLVRHLSKESLLEDGIDLDSYESYKKIEEKGAQGR